MQLKKIFSLESLNFFKIKVNKLYYLKNYLLINMAYTKIIIGEKGVSYNIIWFLFVIKK